MKGIFSVQPDSVQGSIFLFTWLKNIVAAKLLFSVPKACYMIPVGVPRHPIVYLQRVRVETGKRLLEETRKTFDEITYLVGYEDSSYFRKVFIKQTGLRPQNYRKKFQTIP